MICYEDNLPYGLLLVNDRVVRKKATCGLKETFEFTEALINWFISNPDPFVVPVYALEVTSDRPTLSTYGEFSYYYDMKRLGSLSAEEKQLVDLIGDGWSRDKKIPAYAMDIPVMKNFKCDDLGDLIKFLSDLLSQNRYYDLHGGNVMKDEEDNYLLIDLEGFSTSTDFATEVRKWWKRQ